MQTVNTDILITISEFFNERFKRSVWLWRHAESVIAVDLTASQDLQAGNAGAGLGDPQVMACRKSNHLKWNALEVFRTNQDVSVGSEHHPSRIRRTYIEESEDPAGWGVATGRGFGAFARPGGYAKVESSSGKDWAASVAWGGSSSDSYAYAGQNGMFGMAGPGGHAFAVRGSGNDFDATIYEPGGHVTTRYSDGSTSRGKVGDENRGRIRHSDEDEGAIWSSDGDWGAVRHSDDHRRAPRYIDDEDEGPVRYSGNSQEVIRFGGGNQREFKYSEKKKKALTYGNGNHSYYER
ncbi:hypothetical protein JMJ35_010213 [Cladonia borealis]|uniref:Uncharacterized protein n=1 Tax=Cladonia borealis TaxID=184061 RepID=A0AA39QQB4_9LECA|nr:hypothetical protein JMJ35_010213 [Cladonia borealis]